MRENGSWSFRKRFAIALCLSLAIHALMLLYAARRISHYEPPVMPMAVTLLPQDTSPPPPAIKEVVDAVAPTNEPVTPTDRIAEQNTQAQDMSNNQGPADAPHVDEISDRDEPPAAPAPKQEQSPQPQTQKKKPNPPAKKQEPEEIPQRPQPSQTSQPQSSDSSQPTESEPIPIPASPAQPHNSRGRVDGGVKNLGFLGFEAMRNEIAPYLKEVRARVEKQWYAALQLRYKGTSPTRAVIDCTIGPDGNLIAADIVESGDSPTFAPLCKQAMRDAAPFPPFPFKVPEMYQTKNLEIRWTFDFLM